MLLSTMQTAVTAVTLLALSLANGFAHAQTRPKVTEPAATAKFLQEVAWETVQEYHGK